MRRLRNDLTSTLLMRPTFNNFGGTQNFSAASSAVAPDARHAHGQGATDACALVPRHLDYFGVPVAVIATSLALASSLGPARGLSPCPDPHLRSPSNVSPRFDPPVARYQAFRLESGTRLQISTAG